MPAKVLNGKNSNQQEKQKLNPAARKYVMRISEKNQKEIKK